MGTGNRTLPKYIIPSKKKRSGVTKLLTVGSLNVRGIRKTSDQTVLADDMQRYKVDILGVQERHLKGSGVINIRSSDNKDEYKLYYTGPQDNKHHGVGILAKKDLLAEYKKISDRTCMATIWLEGQRRKLHFISTYAPTLQVSEKHENIREEYYSDLSKAMKEIKNRNMVIIAGDMNAKTGSGYKDFQECMGRYGKGEMNSNGEHLIEFVLQHELFLSNTKFPHKMCHRTTWTCPERKNEFKDKNGEVRRNPYRNQIDYIMIS